MTRKIAFFEGWSWFKFNNLRLALGTNLKFCTSVAKGLELKFRKFWGSNSTFVEVTGENLVGGGTFCSPTPPPPSWIGLKLLQFYFTLLILTYLVFNLKTLSLHYTIEPFYINIIFNQNKFFITIFATLLHILMKCSD